MAQPTSVTIKNERGAVSPGEAEDAVQYSNAMRISLGVLYIVGGLFFAGSCLVAPGPHIVVTTWAFPALGIYLGVRTLKRKSVVYDITGKCPTCNEQMELRGGSVDDPHWQKCPHCEAVLTVEPAWPGGSAVKER